MNQIGLALGAGGARGLAHIVIAEAFEEAGIIPSIISGSSIGALVGAAMAAGKSSAEMKSLVKELVLEDKASFLNIRNTNIKKLFDLMDPTMNTTALMKGDKFHKQFLDFIGIRRFDELSIPCSIVATNYHDREVGIFSQGYISAPLKASYSLPGLFPPVKINNELYYDGGMVNPLPFDLIKDQCDVLIAVDVISDTGRIAVNTPTLTEVLFSSFQIMNKSIIKGMLAKTRPDTLLTIKIPDIRTLEFNRADEIYNLTQPFKDQLVKVLESLK